jgi:hypothetical protein
LGRIALVHASGFEAAKEGRTGPCYLEAMMTRVGFSGGLRVASLVVAMVAGRPALAQVTQTDAAKTALPQPVGTAEHNLVDLSMAWNADTQVSFDQMGVILTTPLRYGEIYAPPAYPQFVTGDAITLGGLFKWRKEAIDPVKDAKTGPGHFSAKCGFSVELVLMGGNCQAKFGWYNVTAPTSTTPPTAAEIYPLIDVPQQALKCVNGDGKSPKSDGFCPLAWDNRDPYNPSIVRWTPQAFSSGDLSQDPRYKGGDVAFAFIGDKQKCPQPKYSMSEHNQRNAGGVPWVTTLFYQSTIDPKGVYMAFEDLPMSPDDWKKSGSLNDNGADGDFNDYVVYVSRASCPGDVDPCDGVVCTDGEQCVDGACSSAPSGTGGTGGAKGTPNGGKASTEAAGSGMADAGEESTSPESSGGAGGEEDHPSATGGADAGGSAVASGGAPNRAPEKSSGCSLGVLASDRLPSAWPVLGVAFGLAFARRRRARSN